MDPKHPGLILKNGARTGKRWFFRTTRPASPTRAEILIGDYPAVSIEEARSHRATMAKERAAGRLPTPPNAATGGGKTVGDLFDWFQKEYSRVKRDSSVASDAKLIDRHIRPAWEDLPLEDWTADRIDAVVQSLFNATKKGRQAEKLRVLISAANSAARGKSRRWTEPVPWVAAIPNPMADVRQLPDRTKIAGKRPENYKPKLAETQRFYANLAKLGDPYCDVLRLQVLTCARIGEVTELPWAEIDLSDGTWTLPAERAKNATEHAVMLPEQAVELLQRRWEHRKGEFVFPSRLHPEDPVATDTVRRRLATNRAKLGVADRFTSHAVRHGCLTWMAEHQIGREVRDRVSNHLPAAGADRVYSAAELNEPARRALQRWADAATGAGGKIIALNRA